MSETIPGVLREAAARYGEKTALIASGVAPVSFAGLDMLSDAFARALIADGMAAGERVAVWAPNSAEWIAAAIGAQRAGGTMVPLYFRLSVVEVSEILRRSQASYLVCTAERAAQLEGEALPTLRRTIHLEEGPWRDFLDHGRSVGAEALRQREAGVTGSGISDIMFTSGTTGRPKGAVFSHQSSVAAARIMQHYNGATGADCFCPMGSFAHVGGYKQGWLTGLVSGASVCWGDALDPPSALGLIEQLGVTIMPAAPITWQGILDYPERARHDIASLRFAATGATIIPPELVRRLIAETGIRQVGTGYGMTESCGLCAYTLPEHPVEKLVATVGTPAPDTELRIVDPAGRELGPEQPGEILVRSPRLLVEYLDDPAATEAALTADGWFHTGDIGSIDADGFLSITDRLKDMYIINGLNVYPAEVERAIETLEGVGQCAVVGLPEPRKGEVGAAFVVRAPGSALSADEVVEHCRRSLAHYKVPASVAFVEALPRNVMGKVLKHELRKLGG